MSSGRNSVKIKQSDCCRQRTEFFNLNLACKALSEFVTRCLGPRFLAEKKKLFVGLSNCSYWEKLGPLSSIIKLALASYSRLCMGTAVIIFPITDLLASEI